LVLGAFAYALVRLRRGLIQDREARSQPFGSRVQLTAAARCSLCGADLGGTYRSGGQAFIVAQLKLCEGCYSGDYCDRVARQGLRYGQFKLVTYPREGPFDGETTIIGGAIPYRLGLRAAFSRKQDAQKLGNVFGEVLAVGEPDFDDLVLVSTDTPVGLRYALQDSGVREAIATTVMYSGLGFKLEGNRVAFDVWGTSDGDKAKLRCCLAVLLVHLERIALRNGLDQDAELARYPDLSPYCGGESSPVRRILISRAMIDDLEPVATLYKAQADDEKPLTGLGLRAVRLRSRSLDRLHDLNGLSHLWLEGVSPIHDLRCVGRLSRLQVLAVAHCPVQDITPIAGITTLRELSLQHTAVADISCLAGLTNLTHLDLRYTKVSDVAPLRELKQLKMLQLAGAPISQKQTHELRAMLPELEFCDVC
jgi:hypothetical protein